MSYKSAEEDHRSQLLAKIQVLESQLATARAQLAALDSNEVTRTPTPETPERRTLPVPTALTSPPPDTVPQPEPSSPTNLLAPLSVTADSPVEDKIALFMARFVGRADVYATRWVSKTTGKQGWGPALRNKYKRQPTPKDFLPFTASVVDTHLRRSAAHNAHSQDTFHAGIYPMLPGDQCQLLACDFDDGDWKSNASAYVKACNKAGIDTLTEISRSRSGAHVWMFLEKPMPAARVRAAGMSLLRSAMAANPNMNFSSYDRFFPAQDTLFKNQRTGTALGNLIALPLQGDCRRQGTTVFVDPETWEPFADQFAALSSTQLTTKSQISAPAGEETRARVGPTHELQPRPRRAELRANAKQHVGKNIRLRTDGMVHIPEDDLPGNVITGTLPLRRRPSRRGGTPASERPSLGGPYRNSVPSRPHGRTNHHAVRPFPSHYERRIHQGATPAHPRNRIQYPGNRNRRPLHPSDLR